MKEVFVPQLGMAMEECILISWEKQPGDEVVDGDVVAIIETDKAEMELPSPGNGRLGNHAYAEGATVPVGEVIAYVLEAGDDDPITGADTDKEPTATKSGPSLSDGQPSTEARSSTVDEGKQVDEYVPRIGAPPPGPGQRQPHRLSPRQRRVQAGQMAGEKATSTDDPVDRHRRAIAASVSESWRDIPHFSVTREIRADRLRNELRVVRSDAPEATLTDLLVRAFAGAIAAHKESNDISLGLAVATERGVSIPIIPNVLSRDVRTLTQVRKAATARALEGKYHSDDALPADGTLSNIGSRQVDHFTGVIPVKQGLLLTVGTIKDRPVVLENGSLGVRPTLFATLNLDHRSYDGAHGADLLEQFAALIAEPNSKEDSDGRND